MTDAKNTRDAQDAKNAPRAANTPTSGGVSGPDNVPTMPLSPSGKAGPSGASAAIATKLPAAPRPSPLPREVSCPICKTTFAPRSSAGRCPVCGEQVLPAAAATREVPVLSPTGRFLAAGGWRAVLLVFLLLYEIALFIFLWVALSRAHLL